MILSCTETLRLSLHSVLPETEVEVYFEKTCSSNGISYHWQIWIINFRS